MKKYIWASVHTPTQEQVESLGNISYLKDINASLLARMADCPSNEQELITLAHDVCRFLRKEGVSARLVQPAGSPAFQFMLGSIMSQEGMGLSIVYAHSKRVSEDVPQPDGTIKKISTFKHEGWIEL